MQNFKSCVGLRARVKGDSWIDLSGKLSINDLLNGFGRLYMIKNCLHNKHDWPATIHYCCIIFSLKQLTVLLEDIPTHEMNDSHEAILMNVKIIETYLGIYFQINGSLFFAVSRQQNTLCYGLLDCVINLPVHTTPGTALDFQSLNLVCFEHCFCSVILRLGDHSSCTNSSHWFVISDVYRKVFIDRFEINRFNQVRQTSLISTKQLVPEHLV